jgi:hypothetical protein
MGGVIPPSLDHALRQIGVVPPKGVVPPRPPMPTGTWYPDGDIPH